MSEREVKTYLKQYRRLGKRIERIKKEQERSLAERQALAKELEGHVGRIAEIEALISRVEKRIWREVLAGRYIYGYTNEQNAEQFGYSSRQIQRIITRAVSLLAQMTD